MFVSWWGSPWGGLPMGSRQPSGRFSPNFYDIVPHMRWWCAESGEWNKSKLKKFFFFVFHGASKHGEAISTTSRSIPPKLLSYSAPYEVTATQKFGAKKVKIEEVFFFELFMGNAYRNIISTIAEANLPKLMWQSRMYVRTLPWKFGRNSRKIGEVSFLWFFHGHPSPWGGLPMGSRQLSSRFLPNFWGKLPLVRTWCDRILEWFEWKLEKLIFRWGGLPIMGLPIRISTSVEPIPSPLRTHHPGDTGTTTQQ